MFSFGSLQRAQYQDKLARQRYEDQLRQQVRPSSNAHFLAQFPFVSYHFPFLVPISGVAYSS